MREIRWFTIITPGCGYCDGSCQIGLCPVEGCTAWGTHTHDGATYLCSGAHCGGVCDGSCAAGVPSGGRHHGAGNGNGHHGNGHH